MICKVCGYEDSENFLVCPCCRNVTPSQNQISLDNQNNQSNYDNFSPYQMPFLRENSQNKQYNEENQQNNYNSAPTNSYQSKSSYQNTSPRRYVTRRYPNYGRNMPDYFRGFCCSFENTPNELKMRRILNGGDFCGGVFLLIALVLLLIVGIPVAFCYLVEFFPILEIISGIAQSMTGFLFILLLILILGLILGSSFLSIAEIRVNRNGITIKTLIHKYFIPSEKIDSLVSRTVTRGEGDRRGRAETFSDVFIIMKDRSICNKIELDTGLCYKNKVHVDYLIDEFHEHLGFL